MLKKINSFNLFYICSKKKVLNNKPCCITLFFHTSHYKTFTYNQKIYLGFFLNKNQSKYKSFFNFSWNLLNFSAKHNRFSLISCHIHLIFIYHLKKGGTIYFLCLTLRFSLDLLNVRYLYRLIVKIRLHTHTHTHTSEGSKLQM